MGMGLIELNENDSALSTTPVLRFFYTGVLTGSYYLAARKNNFFQCRNKFLASVGLFSVLAFYFSKGLAYHTAGLNAVYKKNKRIRNAQFESYEREALQYK